MPTLLSHQIVCGANKLCTATVRVPILDTLQKGQAVPQSVSVTLLALQLHVD